MLLKLERILLTISKGLALMGGVGLLGLALMTVYSIVGRTIVKSDLLRELSLLSWWRPVRGDFELTELVTALAIFAFLPYCQMVRGHVIVDFFTNRVSARLKTVLESFANLLFFILSGILCWRMAVASLELATTPFKQSTMILKIPTWWGLSVATLFMGFLSMVCLFGFVKAVLETRRPSSISDNVVLSKPL